ncbi:FdhF/YdeP family oxidoreductase [Chryseolinea lacunae]|uniref:FdhF/YdeP family oxidoreductase n=1 Tax=Chryseolinea lacunae TaxID=2801331 RepID=A0ABS1KNG3_9BACT|nr:FdhF/YdeP family oxidoreductase [Chryseolinea lacunae]MBL0740999.1 FdhF/YdeP family oxidoreductase [Chryseolinea lacunae]
MSRRKVSIVGPDHFTDIKLGEPKEFAAGLPAVKVALDHALKEMGLLRSIATLSKLNQKDGFDCPGCAWPDPEKRSSLGEFCENGVKAIAEEATTKRVTADFFKQHSVSEMSAWTDYEIGKSGRLTDPMILKPGSNHYEPISWNDAFDRIAQSLRNLKNPNEALFYTSGRSSNEAAFLYGLFVRAFGTNNMPDCSNMCHESSGVALGETLGIGKGSVTLEDFGDAEVVMVIGQNPGTNHPRMLSALEKCKENGGKIVAINPLKEAGLLRFKNPQHVNGVVGGGTSLTDHFLQVKVNQDVALLKLILKKLARLEAERGNVFDRDFINTKTQGLEALLADLENYDDQTLLLQSGVDAVVLDAVVQLLAGKKRIIICWAMGLTQHKNGVDNIKECVNLLLLKGSIGKKGAGTCPVRGHSNVQGDRTVGITHHVSPKLNEAYQRVFGFVPPAQQGLDVVHSIKAMHEGKANVFIALGGNFLSAASDTVYTGEALQNCELTVSISTKLNRTHLVPGQTSLILPTLGRTEQDLRDGKERFVTVENSMGRVHQSHGRLTPSSTNLMSEPEIVAGIAKAYFGESSSIAWDALGKDYDLVREKIAQVFTGFNDYTNRSKDGGFDLPNHTRFGDFSKLPGGRASFSLCKLPNHSLTDARFLLTTIRSHDQFNTTIYGLNDRYRGIHNERRVVFINPDDARELGFTTLDRVDLVSHYAGKKRRATNFLIVPYDIPKGNLAAYFPETNVLIPNDQFADKSNTPISKSVEVDIERVLVETAT